MHSKGPAIPVRLNRRVLLRPVAMMSGDNLPDIRKATRDNRAEFGHSVKVYNGAMVSAMNRELSLQYKGLSSKVNNFRRKQQTMYKTMCQLVALKRRMMREAYEKEQRKVKEMDIVARSASVEAGGSRRRRALPPVANTTRALAEVIKANNPAEYVGARAAVASSREESDDAAPPAMRADAHSQTTAAIAADGVKTSSNSAASIAERALMIFPAGAPPPETARCRAAFVDTVPAQVVTATNAKRAFFTATISKFPMLPPIGELPRGTPTDDGVDSAAAAEPSNSDDPAPSERQGRRRQLRNGRAYAASEDARSAADASSGSAESASGMASASARVMSEEPSVRRSIPLSKELRRVRYERERRRKELLDNELCPVYRQNAAGDFRTEHNNYRREEFSAPSGYEEHRRRKLLEAVRDAVTDQLAKANVFLASLLRHEDKIRLPEIKRAESPVPIVRRRGVAPPVGLSDHSERATTEDLEGCAYVRRYVRPSDRDTSLPAITSWNQRE